MGLFGPSTAEKRAAKRAAANGETIGVDEIRRRRPPNAERIAQIQADLIGRPEDGQHDGISGDHPSLKHNFAKQRWLGERANGIPEAEDPVKDKFPRVWE